MKLQPSICQRQQLKQENAGGFMNSLFHHQAPRRLLSNITATFTVFLLYFLRGQGFYWEEQQTQSWSLVSTVWIRRMATKGNYFLLNNHKGICRHLACPSPYYPYCIQSSSESCKPILQRWSHGLWLAEDLIPHPNGFKVGIKQVLEKVFRVNWSCGGDYTIIWLK